MSKHVYIILVNYQRWEETIECLESLFKQSYSNYTIIVVDNASPNQSMKNLLKWANGEIALPKDERNSLFGLTRPVSKKPVSYSLFNQQETLRANPEPPEEKLIFIQAQENRGFAAGNNIALRYALQKLNADYFWILNNDTVVEPEALSHLVRHLETSEKTQKTGLLGCKVRYYHNPNLLQCAGGATYNFWTAHCKMRGNGELDKGQYDKPQPDLQLIIGASIFVSRLFIQDVGQMCEDYFIYFEEQDWAERARRKGWLLDYEWRAVIYHKEGATIGAGAHTQPSFFSQFYWLRNKLLFTRKFGSPFNVMVIYAGFFLNLAKRAFKGELHRFFVLSQLLFNPMKAFANEKIAN
jgi:GT2 family glycosyltransferase